MNMLRKWALLGALMSFGFVATTVAEDETPPKEKPKVKAAIKVAPAVRLLPLVGAKKEAAPKKELSAEDMIKATPTHEKAGEIKVESTDGKMRLQTLTADQKGNVLGLVSAPRFSDPSQKINAEVHVFNADGKKVRDFKVGFNGQSLNVGLDGTVYVAGDGKVAKFSAEGKSLGTVELPHIAEMLKDDSSMKKDAEAKIKEQKDSFERSVKSFKERLEKLEAKKPEDLTKAEENQLKQFKQIMESFKQTEKHYASMTVESVIKDTVARLRTINAVAIGSKDLFIVCGETKGYGFAIWRMTHDLKSPVKVLGSVSGCCGQMDLQVDGSDFLLAENTKYQFARYDRDGKKSGAWGKGMSVAAGQECPPECFGGCCNPMNLRITAKGNIFTAESEGVIKCYSSKGEFISTVARAPLTGGCKNVAVAVTPDEKTVFFCDQPGSKIVLLKRKDAVSQAR